MLRSPAIAGLALKAIEPTHLGQVGGARFQAVLYFIIQNYYTQFKTAPDEAVIRAEIKQVIENFGKGGQLELEITADLEEFVILSKLVDTQSEPLARKIIQYIADKCIYKPAANELLQTAIADQKIENLGKKLTDLERQQMGLGGSHMVKADVFAVQSDDGERVTTGIPWLDEKFGKGRGLPLGSSITIIAPQRSGKTTLGISLSINQALQQRHTLLVLAEQGMDKSVTRKIKAASLGCDYTLFAKHNDDMEAVLKEAAIDKDIADKRIEAVNKYLHYMDLIKDPGGVSTIISQIEAMISDGIKPTYIYVDWAGKLADTVMGGSEGIDFKSKFEALKHIASELTGLAARHDLIMCISQQMSATSVKKGFFADNGLYCAADCHSWTELFRYVVVLNERDKSTKLQLLHIPKSREDEPPEPMLVKLRGEFCDFQDYTSSFMVAGKKFKSKVAKVPQPGKLPT